jgi:hypothetical protein
MTRPTLPIQLLAAILLIAATADTSAQQLSIPQIVACKNQYVGGKMMGLMPNRKDADHTGEFQVTVDARCANGILTVNNLEIHSVKLADTVLKGIVHANEMVQLASLGKAAAPTVFLSGPCKVFDDDIEGCQFWLMLVDNRQSETPDILSFVVVDGTGKRLAYGTGLVGVGDVGIDENE